MPQSAFVALLVTALVPGYCYLVLTEGVRRPRDQTPLAEVLQVVLVGIATTGVAGAALGALAPGWALDVLASWQSGPTVLSSHALREAIGLAALMVGIALALAWILAMVTRTRAKHRFSPTVMQGALGQAKARHARWVGVELDDGTVFDGKLSAYPFTDDRGSIIIALEKPIRRFQDKKVKELPFERLVLSGGDIAYVAMNYQPQKDPLATGKARGTKRLAACVARQAQRYVDR